VNKWLRENALNVDLKTYAKKKQKSVMMNTVVICLSQNRGKKGEFRGRSTLSP
jgi:hypothetical protein